MIGSLSFFYRSLLVFLMATLVASCNEEIPPADNDVDARMISLMSELQTNLESVNQVEIDISRGYLLASLPASESEQMASIIHELKVSLMVLKLDVKSLDAFHRFDRYVNLLDEAPLVDKDRGPVEALIESLAEFRNSLADFHEIKVTKQLYFHDFKDGTGGFKTRIVEGSTSWTFEEDSAYMKISAYNRGASEAWLLSPRFDLEKVSDAYMQLRQTHAFFTTWDDLQVLVSSDYSGGDPSGATWEAVNISLRPAEDEKWQFVTSERIDLSQYQGKKLTVGFRYRASPNAAPTWEIDSLLISGSGEFKAEPIIDADSIAKPSENRGASSGEGVGSEDSATSQSEGNTDDEETAPALWSASLKENIAPFKEINIAGEAAQLWSVEAQFQAAKANGYQKGPNQNWLVSPRLTIEAGSALSLTLDQAVAFFTTWDHMQIKIAVIDDSFDGSLESFSSLVWDALSFSQLPVTTEKWSFKTTESIDLSKYSGSTILISFQYTCEESAAAGWEVRNVRLDGTGKVEASDL